MPTIDRRKEPRRRANGTVSFRLEERPEREYRGQLLDVSNSGFRAIHSCRDVSTGDVVLFQHSHGSGRARAIWKRIHPDEPGTIEAGFMIVAG